jgi:hypothetical protein
LGRAVNLLTHQLRFFAVGFDRSELTIRRISRGDILNHPKIEGVGMAEEQAVHASEAAATGLAVTEGGAVQAVAPVPAVPAVRYPLKTVTVVKKLSPQAARAAELVRIKRKKHRHAQHGRNTRG